MSVVSLVPSVSEPPATLIGEPASLTIMDELRCALCGGSLVGKRERYRLVSPFVSMGRVTVGRLCWKATGGEGYRPAS